MLYPRRNRELEARRRKQDIDLFLSQHEKVVAEWPTGREIDIDEAIAYQKSLPDTKKHAKVWARAKARGDMILIPRAGVATLENNIALLQYLRREGGADVLRNSVDSYTRLHQFDKCASAIEESRRSGRSALNGFPVVNHGVKGCRQVVEALDVPWHTPGGGPEMRLMVEIPIMAGNTAMHRIPVTMSRRAFIATSKNHSLEQLRTNEYYLNGLWSSFKDRGVELLLSPAEYYANVVEPSMFISWVILGLLEALQRGLNPSIIGLATIQLGNLLQDVAALRVLEKVTDSYRRKMGYDEDLTVVLGMHQWMGAFPEDEAQAFGLICLGAATAALGGCNVIVTKTTDEAAKLPTREANAASLRAIRYVTSTLREQKYPDSAELKREIDMLEQEVVAIMDKVVALGEGSVALGIERAFGVGVLDDVFSTSLMVKRQALHCRDSSGAIRWLDPGNVPVPKEVLEYHQEKLAERAKKSGKAIGYEMLIEDCYALSGATSVKAMKHGRDHLCM